MWHCNIAPLVAVRLSEPCLLKNNAFLHGEIEQEYTILEFSHASTVDHTVPYSSKRGSLSQALLTSCFLLRSNFHFS